MLKRLLQQATNRITELPVLVLMPHSRCNCRCVMCDIWKANQEKREISSEQLAQHVEAFKKLGVGRVALSGGEALMHSDLWRLCKQLNSIGIKISLLSTGLTLKANAENVMRYCSDVIVSLDGSREIHNMIRNIPNAFDKLTEGVSELKGAKTSFRVTGRCVLQKQNFRDFTNIVRDARNLGLDQISFLAADVSSSAFNHVQGWAEAQVHLVALTKEEANEFEEILKHSFTDLKWEYENHFIAESPTKMLRLPNYYRAVAGVSAFPEVRCNAPWVSAVVEPNGDVLPCFFHKPYGNLRDGFENVINSPEAISFRKKLDVHADPVCQRCVCSLYLGPLTEA